MFKTCSQEATICQNFQTCILQFKTFCEDDTPDSHFDRTHEGSPHMGWIIKGVAALYSLGTPAVLNEDFGANDRTNVSMSTLPARTTLLQFHWNGVIKEISQNADDACIRSITVAAVYSPWHNYKSALPPDTP